MSNGVYSIALAAPALGPVASPRANTSGAFLVGPENQLVVVAIESVCKSFATPLTAAVYNPLFIHGPPGAGKSHLARGMAKLCSQQLGSNTVVCLTGHEFAQDFARAVDKQRVDAWREEIRRVALFVLEDIEQLSDKPAAQHDLIATLDTLEVNEGRAVVTSRHPLRELTALPARLRSRLSAGLELPLQPPGRAARLALLQQFAQARGLVFANSAAEVLADGLATTAPELFGVLTSLEVSCRSAKVPLDADAARQHLIEREQRTVVGLRSIGLAAARYFELKLDDLKSPSRQRPIVTARCVAMYLARKLTTHSLQQIGKYFGGRDHTTVLHGCRRADQLLQSDPVTRQAVADLQARLIPA